MRTWRLQKAFAIPMEPTLLDDVHERRPLSLERNVRLLAPFLSQQTRPLIVGSPSGCEARP